MTWIRDLTSKDPRRKREVVTELVRFSKIDTSYTLLTVFLDEDRSVKRVDLHHLPIHRTSTPWSGLFFRTTTVTVERDTNEDRRVSGPVTNSLRSPSEELTSRSVVGPDPVVKISLNLKIHLQKYGHFYGTGVSQPCRRGSRVLSGSYQGDFVNNEPEPQSSYGLCLSE